MCGEKIDVLRFAFQEFSNFRFLAELYKARSNQSHPNNANKETSSKFGRSLSSPAQQRTHVHNPALGLMFEGIAKQGWSIKL